MQVVIDLCLIPMGVGVSVSRYVAACQEILNKSGLSYNMHAYGTNIEGEWTEVMSVVKQCHDVVHAMGAPRISSTIKLGTRTDRIQTMSDKIQSVEAQLSD